MEQTDEEIREEVEGLLSNVIMEIYETIEPESTIEDKVEIITMLFNMNMNGVATIRKHKVREILDKNTV